MNEKTYINSEPEMGNAGTLQVTGIKGHSKEVWGQRIPRLCLDLIFLIHLVF